MTIDDIKGMNLQVGDKIEVGYLGDNYIGYYQTIFEEDMGKSIVLSTKKRKVFQDFTN